MGGPNGQETAMDSPYGSAAGRRNSLISSQGASSSASRRFSSNSSRFFSANLSEAEGSSAQYVHGNASPRANFVDSLCCGLGKGQALCGRRGWLASNSRTVLRCRRVIRSGLWKVMMTVFYIFVLFGSQIVRLWAPHDVVIYNILALVTFSFCLLDIALRIISEPSYFRFGVSFGGFSNSLNRLGFNGLESTNKTSSCALGSFLFWCDLISTGIILYDISWVNPERYRQQSIDILLDSGGFPLTGFDDDFRLKPVPVEVDLLVTIARCARAARFVRSRTVVNANSQINWYWLFQHLKWCNPFFYYRTFLKRKRQNRESLRGMDESTAFAANRDDKRTSWGVLQIGILAAVRAQAEAEAREAKENKKSESSVWDSLKQSFRTLKLGGSEHTHQMRVIAATKIQRAWKQHRQFDDEFGAFLSTRTSRPINRLERGKEGKRSTLARFAQMNAHAGGKLDRHDIKASSVSWSANEKMAASRFQSNSGKGRESQVGSDMRELTGQRVAFGVLLALVFTVVFTYTEADSTRPTTMVVLHNQTMKENFRMEALYAARNTSTPSLFRYEAVDEGPIELEYDGVEKLSPRQKVRYTVTDALGRESVADFAFGDERRHEAVAEIAATVFIILLWFFGVSAFAGPVMSLVVIPIERMVRLLGMLMMDPLGYQSTDKFKNFLIEEDDLIKNTRWTRAELKGMETSFLMSTILRIGSLMKVGFGSAGVEIIRGGLQKGQSKIMLTQRGSTVSCIFLFCDIRQFTDATECLQEEVFVFTNRIAAVVHSICHSYGGAANKNVGDAFLLSWSLEDTDQTMNGINGSSKGESDGPLKATTNQADKALLSVIKIRISLYYDKYYLEPLSESAKNRLQAKLVKRSGPVVQMGFGLHAGKAVHAAIGSQRKIDATYVSEAVERAEFLESSTKKYGIKMLMSGAFHRLLHPNTRRRCRKVDRILLKDEDEDEDEDDAELHGEFMELFTFDIDVAAIHRPVIRGRNSEVDTYSDSGSANESGRKARRGARSHGSTRQIRNRRRSVSVRMLQQPGGGGSEELQVPGVNPSAGEGHNPRKAPSVIGGSIRSNDSAGPHFLEARELILPSGPALYSHNVWQSPDMKKIRDKYVVGLFSQKFEDGFHAFYGKDWDKAKQCFQTVLENFDDGPSQYFLSIINEHNGVPPKGFLDYGLA